MTTEELKKHVKEIQEGINTSFDEKLETASKQWEEKYATRSEQKEIVDGIKADFVQYQDVVKKLQEHADELDVKLQSASPSKAKHKLIEISDLLKSDEAFKKFSSKNADKVSLPELAKALSYKVDDMTQSNTLDDVNEEISPHRVPGIFFDPDTPFRVRNLMPVGTTTSNLIRVVYESAIDDNTDVTDEGSTYKQGDFDLDSRDAVVYKITNYVIVSEEMLEDVDGLSSYIYTRLPSKIAIKENNQLLYGTGASEIYGISENATAYSDNLDDSNVNMLDVLADAARQIIDDEYQPSAFLMHPADVFKYLVGKKDDNARYLGDWIFRSGGISVRGIPVIETTAVTEGHFFVGDWKRAAQVFDRRQNTVEMVNTNEDNFIKGMITVRGAERIALAIYRPTAFMYGSIANALAVGSA